MTDATVSIRRRLARLARTGSPTVVLRAARRELLARRHEAALASAARTGGRVLAGPFLGEVGYELLYWIPTLRRMLRGHGIGPERVTVLTRGGAAVWYRDLAESSIEILDLLPPELFTDELVARRRREGNAKQFFRDDLDDRLTGLALERTGGATVLHPLAMFSRLRFLWEGLQPPAAAPLLADYRPLARDGWELPPHCPADYVAVKLYFSDSFRDDESGRALAARLLSLLAEEHDVVVLTSGVQLDEHREWVPAGDRIHDSSAWVTPQDNLAVQTALVACSRGFACTYGGFSYLGAMLGVPTLALQTREPHPYSRVHLDVLRAAFPEADYGVAGLGDVSALERFAARVVGARR